MFKEIDWRSGVWGVRGCWVWGMVERWFLRYVVFVVCVVWGRL